LLYSGKNCTVTARDARRITAVKMKYMRNIAGYIWTDCKTNTEITKEIRVTLFWTKYKNKEETVCNI
jgi:hypothetical protein